MFNKRGFISDCFQFEIKNKKGQFFILAAVILAVIIVGLSVVYNTVSVSESSRKFYSYSDQLSEETGAVVDYSLYSGNLQVANFVNESVAVVLSSYPGMDIFACYTSSNEKKLTCDNYGEYEIIISLPTSTISIGPGTTFIESGLIGGAGESTVHHIPQSQTFDIQGLDNLTITSGNQTYPIDLTRAEASNNQYYFIFRADTDAGNTLVSQEGG